MEGGDEMKHESSMVGGGRIFFLKVLWFLWVGFKTESVLGEMLSEYR